MSKTLYRTYRPKEFSDVLGQDHIVKTLQNALISGRISHAYIFTGPRGTGKTTIARLFATAINTVPRKNFIPVTAEIAERLRNGTSLDLIEIDAASSTSVEGIRALKETIALTPGEARYKIYIIDEVHMLSTSAFNALLKTLEEPPAHVIFILATTEIHKVPETILSRCQRFDFARFSIADIMTKLRMIAEAEKIQISDEALEMIAITANGGMRDAESLLAQVFALEDKNVTAQEVSLILGTSTSQDVLVMLDALTTYNAARAITHVSALQKNGYNLETFIRSLIEKMRALLFLSLQKDISDHDLQQLIALPKADIITLNELALNCTPATIIMMIEECTSALQKIRSASIPQLPLEIAIVNICMHATGPDQKPYAINSQKPQKKIAQTVPEDHEPHKTSNDVSTKGAKNAKSMMHTPSSSASAEVSEQWRTCVSQIEEIHRPIAQILAQCTLCDITADVITITTDRTFYQERIMQNNHRTIIETAISTHFDKPMRIAVQIHKRNDDIAHSDVLTYAQQLMGGAITS